jgi:hypothetical protein
MHSSQKNENSDQLVVMTNSRLTIMATDAAEASFMLEIFVATEYCHGEIKADRICVMLILSRVLFTGTSRFWLC